MSDIEQLMQVPGTLAAFSFSDKGELGEFEIIEDSSLNETALDLLSHVCVANTAIATMQARGWESMTGNGGFYPVQGFSMIGLDWTTVTHGGMGIVMDNQRSDLEAAYAALAGL